MENEKIIVKNVPLPESVVNRINIAAAEAGQANKVKYYLADLLIKMHPPKEEKK